MKLKIGEKVYLQKYDVGEMLHFCSEYPPGFLGKVFGKDEDIFLMSFNDLDYYNFLYEFDDPSDVEWIMSQDFLVDYSSYKSMPVDNLIDLGDKYREDLGNTINEYNEEPEEVRVKHRAEIKERVSKISHKIDSVDAMIAFRKGAIKFKFPEEVKEWDECSELESKSILEEDEPVSEPLIIRALSALKKFFLFE